MNRLDQLQLDAYAEGRYAETSDKVALCMRVSEKHCSGGECDLGSPCQRHRNISEIVSRWWRRYR